MKYILSIRGGGIRGIIPACCLVRLEAQLGGLTRDHIAYCAGTSTGGLLTAAIAAGVPATDILKVYTDRTKDIFTPRGLIAEGKRAVEGFMYDPAHMHSVIASALGSAAAWVVNDSPIGLMIAATAMNGHNWYFVKDNPKNKGTTGGVKLVDAAVASACAPTYFDHWKIDGIGGRTGGQTGGQTEGQTLYFFDGGTGGTANPVYEACVEAFEYDAFLPADTRVISLGTGYFPGSDTPPSGFLKVIEWSTSTLVDTSEDWADSAVKRQWPGVTTSINPLLPSEIGEDDLAAIPTLVAIGQALAATLDWSKLIG
jgi:predicted acylesterase/phospholipase RssA